VSVPLSVIALSFQYVPQSIPQQSQSDGSKANSLYVDLQFVKAVAMKRSRRPLGELDQNLPPPKKSKPTDESPAEKADRLLVFQLEESVVETVVSQWLSGNAAGSGANSSLPGAIRPVPRSSLKFTSPEVDKFGDCWAYFTRTKVAGMITEKLKIQEAGGNNDAPRWTAGKIKYYMYHVMALHAARVIGHGVTVQKTTQTTISSFFTGAAATNTGRLALPNQLLFTIEDLESVQQSKVKWTTLPKTVMHLCGNKWCMNPRHFFIGLKVFNDEQAYCHKGLHNVSSLAEYLMVQSCYCKHVPKCWGLCYSGELDVTPAFCATGLPVE
jgi:Zinc-binding loop region of homing endonuclease